MKDSPWLAGAEITRTANIRFGSRADAAVYPRHVCSYSESRH
jgi:hypothetical protein